jgi:CheY-like chemotaxis protein
MPPARLLVVDDERGQCELVKKLLSDQGYEVDVADGGEAALELLETNAYELVVLDYQMPGMNGVELFRAARLVQPELVGVFLTAYADISTVFPAMDAGVERVLAKPVDSRELLPLVEKFVGRGDRFA